MIRHVSGIAEVVEDVDAAVRFYEGLGLSVERLMPGYAVVQVPGVLHFGLWSRADCAETVFGSAEAADRVPLGFTLGLEVDSVDGAAGTFEAAALRDARTEPWGQRTLWFRSPSGAMSEISETPLARELVTDVVGKEPAAATT